MINIWSAEFHAIEHINPIAQDTLVKDTMLISCSIFSFSSCFCSFFWCGKYEEMISNASLPAQMPALSLSPSLSHTHIHTKFF